jgi:hypothetical protein
VCELATVDEIASLFGGAALTAEVVAGGADSCIIRGPADRIYASWTLSTTDAALVFDAVNLPSQAEPVPGMGDKAAFIENMGLLILKGNRLLTIVIAGGSDLDEAASKDAARAIGTIAAPRM